MTDRGVHLHFRGYCTPLKQHRENTASHHTNLASPVEE